MKFCETVYRRIKQKFITKQDVVQNFEDVVMRLTNKQKFRKHFDISENSTYEENKYDENYGAVWDEATIPVPESMGTLRPGNYFVGINRE